MTTTDTLLSFEAPTVDHGVADVEIVVPVYNEEACLEASVLRLQRYLTERFPLSWRGSIRRHPPRPPPPGAPPPPARGRPRGRARPPPPEGPRPAARAAWA